MAEHQRLAILYRAAAESDRHQAEEAESQAVAPTGIDVGRFEATLQESRALRRISQRARARARETRERVERGGSRQEILQHSEFARLHARMCTMPAIEQAKGIVMAEQGCGPEEAFEVLRRASQSSGIKVHVLAVQIVEHVASGGNGRNGGNTVAISLSAMRNLRRAGQRPAAVEAD